MANWTYLYIACCGHRGSTLLELLLGSHLRAVVVGEIRHFPRSARLYLISPEGQSGCEWTPGR